MSEKTLVLPSSSSSTIVTCPTCPICLENISKSSLTVLECGHPVCFSCGLQWLPKKMSCPLCRQPSFRFSKRTRSCTKSYNLLNEIRHTQLQYEEYTGIPFSQIVYYDMFFFSEYVDLYYIQQRHLWYRPDMFYMLQSMVEYLERHQSILCLMWLEQRTRLFLLERHVYLKHYTQGRPRRTFHDIMTDFFSAFRSFLTL